MGSTCGLWPLTFNPIFCTYAAHWVEAALSLLKKRISQELRCGGLACEGLVGCDSSLSGAGAVLLPAGSLPSLAFSRTFLGKNHWLQLCCSSLLAGLDLEHACPSPRGTPEPLASALGLWGSYVDLLAWPDQCEHFVYGHFCTMSFSTHFPSCPEAFPFCLCIKKKKKNHGSVSQFSFSYCRTFLSSSCLSAAFSISSAPSSS